MSLRVIEAVAGAGKTRQIVNSSVEFIENGDITFIITLTNSVKAEISARVATAVETEFYSRGNVNTICGSEKSPNERGKIHVASADAFTHNLLTSFGFTINGETLIKENVEIEADDFDGKRLALDTEIKSLTNPVQLIDALRLFSNKYGANVLSDDQTDVVTTTTTTSRVNLLFDEFQDSSDDMVETAANLARAVTSGGGNIIVVGDALQNVFGKSLDAFGSFMKRWNETCDVAVDDVIVARESMATCYRCPPKHVNLVNLIFKEREMLCPKRLEKKDEKDDDEATRPIFVFTNDDPISSAVALASAAVDYIERQNLSLEDVAILAPTTNNNRSFSLIESALNRRLRSRAPPGKAAVKWFMTSQSQSGIDWSQAAGRVAMLSVHADKGRTHKLTIVCDVTEGVIPRPGMAEAQQRSILYVALTRSSLGLIIGCGGGDVNRVRLFGHGGTVGAPSRYIRTAFEDVDELCQHVDVSPYSLIPRDLIEFPSCSAYPEPRNGSVKRSMTTVTQWANTLPSPGRLMGLQTFSPTCHRFNEDITQLNGMKFIKEQSFEFAIGKLAEIRLQRAVNAIVKKEEEATSSGEKGEKTLSPFSSQTYRSQQAGAGWLNQAARQEDPAAAAALKIAARLCDANDDDRGADTATAESLWTLALVALAEVEDSISKARRPWAWDMAVDLTRAAVTSPSEDVKMEPDLIELVLAVDAAATNAAKYLYKRHTPEAMKQCVFEMECRQYIGNQRKRLLSGRLDLFIPDGSFVEIKATTTASNSTSNDGEASCNKSFLNQVLLYSTMAKSINTACRLTVVDVTRGIAFESEIPPHMRDVVKKKAHTLMMS